MQQKKRYVKFLYLFGTIFVLYFGASFILARLYMNPVRKNSKAPPKGLQDTHISGPGYQLPAWVSSGIFDKQPASDTVFILIHGYQGSRDGWRHLAERLVQCHQEVIVPVLISHETSPMNGCTFGKHEAKEVLAAARWARKQHAGPLHIVLVGKSMGGSAAWHAAAIDPTIDAVVSDSAYARFDEAGQSWMKKVFWGADVLLRPMYWMADTFYHLKAKDINPVEKAKNWKGRPALIIHGDQDTLLDVSHATRLAAAAGCPLWIVKGAAHGECSIKSLDLYVSKLLKIAEDSKKRKLLPIAQLHHP